MDCEIVSKQWSNVLIALFEGCYAGKMLVRDCGKPVRY